MHTLRRVAFTLGLLVVVVPAAHSADTDHPGKASYVKYCGACHGPVGKGDGIAGTFMTTKPTDLTTIAKRNGGSFPFTRTMQYIDGTEDVRAHGDPEMPVWGDVFRAQVGWDAARRTDVRGKILLITDYLSSIQVK